MYPVLIPQMSPMNWFMLLTLASLSLVVALAKISLTHE